jgi:hypothetical protein
MPSSCSPAQQKTVWTTGHSGGAGRAQDLGGVLDCPVDQGRAGQRRGMIGVQVLEIDNQDGRPLAGLDPPLPEATQH